MNEAQKTIQFLLKMEDLILAVADGRMGDKALTTWLKARRK